MRSQRGRGRGGGRGSKSSRPGPALPFKIRKELDVDGAAGSRAPKQRGSMFHVSQRKERRRAARHGAKAAAPHQLAGDMVRRVPQEGVPGRPDAMHPGRSGHPTDVAVQREPRPAAKRPAAKVAGRAAASKKTRFAELLDADALKACRMCPLHCSLTFIATGVCGRSRLGEPSVTTTPWGSRQNQNWYCQGTGTDAFSVEEAFQRQLAKKLGIKGKAKRKQAEDSVPAAQDGESEGVPLSPNMRLHSWCSHHPESAHLLQRICKSPCPHA